MQSTTKPAEVHVVVYRHEYGLDTSVYTTEELAYAGACDIISNWLEDLENHEELNSLIDLINEGKHREALTLWSQMVCDLDIMEEIVVDASRPVISEIAIPPIPRIGECEDDEPCTPDGRCEA